MSANTDELLPTDITPHAPEYLIPLRHILKSGIIQESSTGDLLYACNLRLDVLKVPVPEKKGYADYLFFFNIGLTETSPASQGSIQGRYTRLKFTVKFDPELTERDKLDGRFEILDIAPSGLYQGLKNRTKRNVGEEAIPKWRSSQASISQLKLEGYEILTGTIMEDGAEWELAKADTDKIGIDPFLRLAILIRAPSMYKCTRWWKTDRQHEERFCKIKEADFNTLFRIDATSSPALPHTEDIMFSEMHIPHDKLSEMLKTRGSHRRISNKVLYHAPIVDQNNLQGIDLFNLIYPGSDRAILGAVTHCLQEPPPVQKQRDSNDNQDMECIWECAPATFQQLAGIFGKFETLWDEGSESEIYRDTCDHFEAMKNIVFGRADLGLVSQFDEPLFEQLPHVQKHVLMEALEEQKQKLIEFTKSIQGKDEAVVKHEVARFMLEVNQDIKDVTRGALLASPMMNSLEMVKKAEDSEVLKKCDFHLDAGVRRMIIEHMIQKPKKSPALPQSSDPPPETSTPEKDIGGDNVAIALPASSPSKDNKAWGMESLGVEIRWGGGDASTSSRPNTHDIYNFNATCPNCSHGFHIHADQSSSSGLLPPGSKEKQEATVTVPGECDDQLEDSDFIAFPGEIDGKHVKPLIDTGGAANLVSRKWLEEKNITIPDVKLEATEKVKLLNADGSISSPLPVIRMSWKFDDRRTVWSRVKFIVTQHGPDTLLGLPFLKHTQIIHTSKGQLLFPEFENLPSPSLHRADLKPIYHDRVEACAPTEGAQ